MIENYVIQSINIHNKQSNILHVSMYIFTLVFNAQR